MPMNPPPVKPTRDLKQLQHDFQVHGYCLIAEALTPEQLREARKRVVDQAQAEAEVGLAVLMGAKDKPNQQVRNLLGKGGIFTELVLNPIMNEFVESQLGPGYQLSSFVANIMQPGGAPQDFHWDQVPYDNSMGMNRGPTNPLLCAFAAGYALNDFTAENGGTRLVPGSHLWKERPRGKGLGEIKKSGEFINVECPAGTIVAWDGRMLHAGSDNRSQDARVLANCLWTRSAFRTQENHTLCVPQEVLEKGGPALQRLLGFQVFASLGMADGVDGSGDLTTALRRSQDFTPELSPKAADPKEYYFSSGQVSGTPMRQVPGQHSGYKMLADSEGNVGKRTWIKGNGASVTGAPTKEQLAAKL